MKTFIAAACIVLAGALGWAAWHALPAFGVFNQLSPRLVDACRRVDIAPGTEDVAIDEPTGQVFISTFERRGWYAGNATNRPRGAIYLIDLADRALTPREASPDAPRDFSPHGISLWRAPDGGRRLFVVNHRADGSETIEIFDIVDDGALFHAETIAFNAMHSPNDVAAVGRRAFYATNDRKYDSGLFGALELYFALPLTDVVYFDGASGRRVAGGFTYANGVAASASNEEIYVAEVLKRRISVFARDDTSGDLTLLRRIRVNTAPDNIDVAPDGALFIAGHPDTNAFLRHAADADAIAPSHVLRADPETGELRDVFVSLDGEINASSVGAATDDTLIVGAVFDGHVMVCPLEDG